MWESADIPKSDILLPPLLIDLSTTVPYYTMSVSHVEECRHTKVTGNPPSIEPHATEPSTPG